MRPRALWPLGDVPGLTTLEGYDNAGSWLEFGS
jgi:hypothetical protein